MSDEQEWEPGPLCDETCGPDCEGHTLYDLKRLTGADLAEVTAALDSNPEFRDLLFAELCRRRRS